MPPKVLRRPGAAGGFAAAKAKAAAKAGARRGAGAKAKADPGRRGALRRRGRGGDGGPADIFSLEKFDKGDLLSARLIPVEQWSRGLKIVVEEGVYWEEPVRASGVVEKLEIDGEKRMVKLDLRGTQSEGLVKWKGSFPTSLLEVDLCSPECPKISKDGLLHATKLRKWVADVEEPWMKMSCPG